MSWCTDDAASRSRPHSLARFIGDARKPWIVPIRGTSKLHRLEENLGAVDVDLTHEDLAHVEALKQLGLAK